MPMSAGRLQDAIDDVCPVLSCSVGDPVERSTWSFAPAEGASQAEIDAGNQVIATIPVDGQGALSTVEFIARFTSDEYLSFQQARNVAATVAVAQGWDVVMCGAWVNLNKKNVQDLKAAMVAAGILTQARADEIFSMMTTVAGRRRAFPFD